MYKKKVYFTLLLPKKYQIKCRFYKTFGTVKNYRCAIPLPHLKGEENGECVWDVTAVIEILWKLMQDFVWAPEVLNKCHKLGWNSSYNYWNIKITWESKNLISNHLVEIFQLILKKKSTFMEKWYFQKELVIPEFPLIECCTLRIRINDS